jgi:hypothetical protein
VATKAEVFNRALYWLSKARITNPSASTELTDVYDTVRQRVLRSHPWNSAKKRKALTADETTTDWKYAYAYTLPTNPRCLRVLGIEDTSAKWEVVHDRKLVTDVGAPLRIEYIADIDDESIMDPDLIEVLAYALAVAVGPKLGATSGQMRDLRAAFAVERGDARSIDGQEGNFLEIEADDYLSSRN